MDDLLKDNYRVENLVIKNSKFRVVTNPYPYCKQEEKIYEYEDILSDDEKVKIIDSHTNGVATYLLNLISKYILDNSPVKECGKKWTKKNDPRELISRLFIHFYPTYYLFGQEYRLTMEVPTTDGYKLLYNGESIVKQWFHDFLIELVKEEISYFNLTDPIQIKINKVKELGSEIGTADINNERLSRLIYGGLRDGYTDEELNHYIEIMEDIVAYSRKKKLLLND